MSGRFCMYSRIRDCIALEWSYAIVTALACAGLRISEALNLRVGDIDLAAREITVQHGKGDRMRVVFIGDTVVAASPSSTSICWRNASTCSLLTMLGLA